MRVSEILRTAKERAAQGLDVISAIEAAAKGDAHGSASALSLLGALLMTPLLDWEMAPQRKQQDVLSLFDRAIMRAVANERESNDLASRHR